MIVYMLMDTGLTHGGHSVQGFGIGLMITSYTDTQETTGLKADISLTA